MNDQRELIYKKRNRILDSESIHEMVLDTFRNHVEDLVKSHTMNETTITEEDYKDILEFANENLLKKDIKLKEVDSLNQDELIDYISKEVIKQFEDKIEQLPDEITNEFEKVITLKIVDRYWMEHINTMAHLREGIHLRGYAQQDPLRAYTMEGYDLFDKMLQRIDQDVSIALSKAEIRQNIERVDNSKNIRTNDNDTTRKNSPKRVKKIGRNDPCPCGSGKKYKQCHGK